MKRMVLLMAALAASCCAPAATTQDVPENVFVTDSGTQYKVRVEFALPIEYKTRYPFITRGFEDAVKEWARVVPIDPVFIPSHVMGRRGVINVYIASRPDQRDKLGLYYPSMDTLYLNSMSITTYDDAYDVALHEIGHAFGLQHVTDVESNATTGSVVVLNRDPEEMLMYGALTDGNKGVGISELAIELVRENLLRREIPW